MRYLGVPATVRASFYLYNDFDDIDALVEGLKKVRKWFK
jgi:cysteine desulfurase/selenocysteine lyase